MEDHPLTTRYWWSRWMPCCHWVSSKAWTTPTTGLFCVGWRLSQPLFQRTVSFYQAISYPTRRHYWRQWLKERIGGWCYMFKSCCTVQGGRVQKGSRVHAWQCPSNLYSQQQIIQSPESVLLRRFKSPTSPFYYHEEPLATPSSSTTSTSSSGTASTSTSTQLIVDLSMVTKVMVTGVKVGPYTTLKDFRLTGHTLYAARNGCSRTIVRGNDTDICIILLAYLPTLLQCNSSYKLLFDCGTGASRFMFNINHILLGWSAARDC